MCAAANYKIDAIENTDIFAHLRNLSERSPLAMIAVEGSTHLVAYVNPAFAEIAGKDGSDLVGRPFADAVPEGAENGCLAVLDRVFLSGRPENLAEQKHRQKGGHYVYWSYAVWAIMGLDDRPVGLMIQVTDSTAAARHRKHSVEMNEALLVSASKQHELTQEARMLTLQLQDAIDGRDHFLAVLSHELRNPLAALTTGLGLLKVIEADAGVENSPRTMMERQVTQLVRLVDDLLDVSRISRGKLELRRELVDLATVVANALEVSVPLMELRGQKLTVTLPTIPILMDADHARLTQVFLNLLNNAAKYSDPGGHVRLVAEKVGNEVVVSVKDSGIGISAENLPHIFNVFVQVDTAWKQRQGGLGIGLSLVKEFVELHGGTVQVRSEGPGSGSEFIVRLPVSDISITAVPAPTSEESVVPKHRILLVDDNVDSAEALSMMLQLSGHEVRTAYDGEVGVAMAADFRPEVILMDIGMPKVNGYEAARIIRNEPWGASIFLVALTGWGANDDRARTQSAGFDRHLVKPLDFAALEEILRTDV